MKKTTVYLPDDLRQALKRMAAERRSSEADLIREAIGRLTTARAAPAPRLPLFESGKPPIAEDIDAALATGFGER